MGPLSNNPEETNAKSTKSKTPQGLVQNNFQSKLRERLVEECKAKEKAS